MARRYNNFYTNIAWWRVSYYYQDPYVLLHNEQYLIDLCKTCPLLQITLHVNVLVMGFKPTLCLRWYCKRASLLRFHSIFRCFCKLYSWFYTFKISTTDFVYLRSVHVLSYTTIIFALQPEFESGTKVSQTFVISNFTTGALSSFYIGGLFFNE